MSTGFSIFSDPRHSRCLRDEGGYSGALVSFVALPCFQAVPFFSTQDLIRSLEASATHTVSSATASTLTAVVRATLCYLHDALSPKDFSAASVALRAQGPELHPHLYDAFWRASWCAVEVLTLQKALKKSVNGGDDGEVTEDSPLLTPFYHLIVVATAILELIDRVNRDSAPHRRKERGVKATLYFGYLRQIRKQLDKMAKEAEEEDVFVAVCMKQGLKKFPMVLENSG
jgi:hypothetical protein